MEKRTEVAYLLWQIDQGYISAEDRELGENWMYKPDNLLHPDDVVDRKHFLEAADTLLEIIGNEYP